MRDTKMQCMFHAIPRSRIISVTLGAKYRIRPNTRACALSNFEGGARIMNKLPVVNIYELTVEVIFDKSLAP